MSKQQPRSDEDANTNTRYRDHLDAVADEDVVQVVLKDREYGASWKRRGGVGAFMMLARKWDRLDAALNPDRTQGDPREAPLSGVVSAPIPAWDIFTAAVADTRPEGVIDDIRDLRRYLLLVEAEILDRHAQREKAR